MKGTLVLLPAEDAQLSYSQQKAFLHFLVFFFKLVFSLFPGETRFFEVWP